MTYATSETCVALASLADGNSSAAARLMPLVYDELRALARRRLKAEKPGQTLQPTALVHEAFVRLVGQKDARIKGRAHFFALAATMMRRVLVEHARRKKSHKRGADDWQRVPLDSTIVGGSPKDPIDLIDLDDALTRLAALNDRQARVVELRFFAGMSVAEAAEALGVSDRTIEDDWAVAKVWLLRQLSADDAIASSKSERLKTAERVESRNGGR